MKNITKRQKFLNYTIYLVVRLFVAISGIFSYRVNRSTCAALAFVVTYIIPFRREILTQNLIQAFPEMTAEERIALIRKMWEHLLLMGAEFFIGRRRMSERNWRRHVRIADGANNVRVFFPDRPLIVVTGHYGNFEMGAFILGILGYPTHTVARFLDNPYLNRYVTAIREETGQYLINKDGASQPVMKVIEEHGIVAILADQSAGKRGCWVNFFGRKGSTHKVVALLSLQYNAPILVCHCTRVDDRDLFFELVADDFFDPLQPKEGVSTVKEITQWFTTVLENAVRRHPEQYWGLHRRWKDCGVAHPR